MCEIPKWVKQAEILGGEDEPVEPEPDERSCQKYDHACRSLANDPNHATFWGKDLTVEETEAHVDKDTSL